MVQSSNFFTGGAKIKISLRGVQTNPFVVSLSNHAVPIKRDETDEGFSYCHAEFAIVTGEVIANYYSSIFSL
jgi:hypothetical protein